MTTYQATNHAQMANFIHSFTCIQSPISQTRTKPEPDPKPGFCGLPNPKPGFSKKAPGLESLFITSDTSMTWYPNQGNSVSGIDQLTVVYDKFLYIYSF